QEQGPTSVAAAATIWRIHARLHAAGQPASAVLDPALYAPTYRLGDTPGQRVDDAPRRAARKKQTPQPSRPGAHQRARGFSACPTLAAAPVTEVTLLPQPYPGQQWKHGWVPLTPGAARSKNHGKKPGASSALSRLVAEAAETH